MGKKGGAGAGGVWEDGGAEDWSGTKGWCSCRLAVAGAPSQEEASRIGSRMISSREKRRKDGILTGEASWIDEFCVSVTDLGVERGKVGTEGVRGRKQ